MTVDRPVRYRVDMTVEVQVSEQQEKVPAKLLELSETGAFVGDGAGLDEWEPEGRARLALPIPGGGAWSAEIRIVRHGRAMLDLRQRGLDHMSIGVPGWGVEFLDLPDDELERLRDFLELLDTR